MTSSSNLPHETPFPNSTTAFPTHLKQRSSPTSSSHLQTAASSSLISLPAQNPTSHHASRSRIHERAPRLRQRHRSRRKQNRWRRGISHLPPLALSLLPSYFTYVSQRFLQHLRITKEHILTRLCGQQSGTTEGVDRSGKAAPLPEGVGEMKDGTASGGGSQGLTGVGSGKGVNNDVNTK